MFYAYKIHVLASTYEICIFYSKISIYDFHLASSSNNHISYAKYGPFFSPCKFVHIKNQISNHFIVATANPWPRATLPSFLLNLLHWNLTTGDRLLSPSYEAHIVVRLQHHRTYRKKRVETTEQRMLSLSQRMLYIPKA